MRHVEYNPSLVDGLRKKAIRQVFNMNSVKRSWPAWKKRIKKQLGGDPDADMVLGLGDRLSGIFGSAAKPGRGQQTALDAGTAWEGLVCWYCNLCLAGSRTVVIRCQKPLVPDPMQRAITVSHGAMQATLEAGLIAITFPDIAAYRDELFNRYRTDRAMMGRMDKLTQETFKDHEMCIIQCRTGWDDSAQIPMLWDMIYNVKDFRDTNIRIGAGRFSIVRLEKFSYAFVTVPTDGIRRYGAGKTNVRHVGMLTGGNYWGHPTRSGVARSIKEIFNTNFSSGCNRGLREDLNDALDVIDTKYRYFGLS